MDSCPLNLWAISFRSGIINSHQNPCLFSVNQSHHDLKQYSRNGFSFLAQPADEIVESFVLPDNSGGAEPVGNSSSTFGENDSSYDDTEPSGRALMKNVAKRNHHGLPAVRKNPFVEHWLSFPNVSLATKHIGRMGHFCLLSRFSKS